MPLNNAVDDAELQLFNLALWHLSRVLCVLWLYVRFSMRPAGITIIATLSALAAVYLWTIATVMLISRGAISLMSGSRLMYGLELAGPYMMLLIGTGYAVVAWGLFRLHNWARWLAMLVMTIGIASLVPRISMAELGIPVLWYGLQIAVRAAAAWYLAQSPAVIDAFTAKS